MTNEETRQHILEWRDRNNGIFSWPTDACGYDQHIKFVEHRNKDWSGGDFTQFVKDYAISLTAPKLNNT